MDAWPLTLVCPTCRSPEQMHHAPLVLESAGATEVAGDALLRCSETRCGRVYPVIGGVPVVASDLAGVLAHQGPVALASPPRAGAARDVVRAHLDAGDPLRHAWLLMGGAVPSAWADELALPERPPVTSPLVGVALDAWLRAVLPAGARAAVDLGCGVGRGAYALARAGVERVVAVDLLYAPLQLVAALRATGAADVPVRVGGTAVRWAPLQVDRAAMGRVWPLLADVHEPPLPAEAWDVVLLGNVLDSVADPWRLLGQADALLRPGGRLIAVTPFTYDAARTPEERWMGLSARLDTPPPAPEEVLVAALGGADPRVPHLAYDVVEERRDVPWWAWGDGRSHVLYRSHVVVADKRR